MAATDMLRNSPLLAERGTSIVCKALPPPQRRLPPLRGNGSKYCERPLMSRGKPLRCMFRSVHRIPENRELRGANEDSRPGTKPIPKRSCFAVARPKGRDCHCHIPPYGLVEYKTALLQPQPCMRTRACPARPCCGRGFSCRSMPTVLAGCDQQAFPPRLVSISCLIAGRSIVSSPPYIAHSPGHEHRTANSQGQVGG